MYVVCGCMETFDSFYRLQLNIDFLCHITYLSLVISLKNRTIVCQVKIWSAFDKYMFINFDSSNFWSKCMNHIKDKGMGKTTKLWVISGSPWQSRALEGRNNWPKQWGYDPNIIKKSWRKRFRSINTINML